MTATHGAADEVELVERLDAAYDPSRFQAIVIDDEGAFWEPSPLLHAQAGRRPPVVVLVNTQQANRFLPWIEQLEAVHVMQDDNVQRFNDLHVTLCKLSSGDIFGIEKYFAWGAREQAMTLRGSDERDGLYDALDDFTARLCVHGRLRALALTVLDEFVSNALYNAPVDASGAQRFRDLHRATPVSLSDDEHIGVRFCADGRRLGLSVVDPFGSLKMESLRGTLVRGLRRGAQRWDRATGGAGLGFYCAFESLSHLVVNVAPGRRTELIGILALRDTYREFLVSGKSLNMFTAPTTGSAVGAEVEP